MSDQGELGRPRPLAWHKADSTVAVTNVRYRGKQQKIGEGQRIRPAAVAQRFETSLSGVLVAPTEGSTRPVSLVD
jgi:hypothetical protein